VTSSIVPLSPSPTTYEPYVLRRPRCVAQSLYEREQRKSKLPVSVLCGGGIRWRGCYMAEGVTWRGVLRVRKGKKY
jgi:hypothetical protein